MKERLANLVPGRDQLVLAAHPANLAFIQDTASNVKKVLSFYGDRQPLSAEDFALYFDMIDAQLLITDSEKTKEAIVALSPSLARKTHRITSFDSRLRVGSSQERKESKIYYYVDAQALPTRIQLKKILEVLAQHPLFEVVFAFYNGAAERVKELEQQLEELVSSETALLYSIEKIQEYTGQRLIEKWEGWMRERHG